MTTIPATRATSPGEPVIAGVVTILALTILLSLITATLGLGLADLTSEAPGEGVLSARSGLIHGFLTRPRPSLRS